MEKNGVIKFLHTIYDGVKIFKTNKVIPFKDIYFPKKQIFRHLWTNFHVSNTNLAHFCVKERDRERERERERERADCFDAPALTVSYSENIFR